MFCWIVIALIPAVLGVGRECPDSSKCPDTATCCQLPNKHYGCCPMQDAVCCDDHIHCCPKGTECSVGMCIQSNQGNITFEDALINGHIVCPGGQYVCPDDNTCCKAKDTASFGCCPMRDAVCCKDGQHCCPRGTVCDLSSKRCNGKGFTSQMYDSQKNVKVKNIKTTNIAKVLPVVFINATNVICPGSTFQCPNGYTCCKLPSGDYGCCPFENAQCCKDHLHCCPHGMQCDITSKTCKQGLSSISSSLKVPAERIIKFSNTCPDKGKCSDMETCCLLSDGHYGCCPYQDAVCCSDHESCCPNGFQCDFKSRSCVR